jgi:hypothetical protein
MVMRAFDLHTFLPVGAFRLPGVSGSASSLTRWGSNGLAFRTNSNQVVIVRTSLIPATAPPAPAPTPETPRFTVRGRVTDSVTQAPLSGVNMSLWATDRTDADGCRG